MADDMIRTNMTRGVNSKGAELRGELLYTKEGGPYREIAFPFFVKVNAEKNLIERAWAVGPNGREAIVNGSYLNSFDTTNREGGKEYIWDRREATYKEIMSHAEEILANRIDAMGLDKLIREIKHEEIDRADYHGSFDYIRELKPDVHGPVKPFTCDYAITMDDSGERIARIEGTTPKGDHVIINDRTINMKIGLAPEEKGVEHRGLVYERTPGKVSRKDAMAHTEALLKDRFNYLANIGGF